MTVHVSWMDEDHTILCFQFEGSWNWREFVIAMDESSTLMDQVTHTVHHIVDLSNVTTLPNGALTQLRQTLASPQHPNLGLRLVVSASPFIKALADIGRKLSQSKIDWPIQFASTMQDALNIVAQRERAEN